MQKLAEVCIRRPVFASMIVMALVVVGSASYFRLGVDRFPSVELPTVSVRTELPGASVEEMETQVTQKIEEVVNTVQGINELRSLTGPGTSNVSVTFALSRALGVGEVRLVGRLLRAVNIWVEADRLAAYQIPITAIRDAIVRQNADVPGG